MRPKSAPVIWTSALFLCSAFFSVGLSAQAPVASLDTVPEIEQPDESSVPAESLLQAVVELQTLRQEVSSLRGVIESLEYKIAKLERQQTENYQDLDGRLAGLYQNGLSSQSVLASESATSAINAESSNTSGETSPADNLSASPRLGDTSITGITPLSDFDAATNAGAESKLLYERGFSALRSGERELAIEAFTTIVDSYPNSAEVPDSLYWLGQTYWLANKREESRQSFVQLLESFPGYRKAGDAMYRLGIIYDQLGDMNRAADYMNQVLSSGSTQVAAAQAWLEDNAPTSATDI